MQKSTAKAPHTTGICTSINGYNGTDRRRSQQIVDFFVGSRDDLRLICTLHSRDLFKRTPHPAAEDLTNNTPANSHSASCGMKFSEISIIARLF